MAPLDPILLKQAYDETAYRQSQIQGFLYGPEWRNNEGWHTVRNCLLPCEDQVLWRRFGTSEEYEEMHRATMDAIALEQMRIVALRYDELVLQREAERTGD